MSRQPPFPPYPTVRDLPAGMDQKAQYEFAFQLIAEQGEALGDYLFAAVRAAGFRDPSGERWMAMGDLIESIVGKPLTLSYRACDRMKAERGG